METKQKTVNALRHLAAQIEKYEVFVLQMNTQIEYLHVGEGEDAKDKPCTILQILYVEND